ncbi:hypothetical protein GCM10010862_38280 [Devosia nitrariae]|uniref:Uncharacterized protein n=1 Tax=Devosia nitrariae TaxID=2071872 RepID=A0ABQ5W9Q8_9HYPH|nr:hypothetical protein GCM10010862_38280 [Devosia nitrariae]
MHCRLWDQEATPAGPRREPLQFQQIVLAPVPDSFGSAQKGMTFGAETNAKDDKVGGIKSPAAGQCLDQFI